MNQENREQELIGISRCDDNMFRLTPDLPVFYSASLLSIKS